MKNNVKDFLLIIISLILIGGGIIIVKTITEPSDMMQALPYVCVGLGCGIFGHGMGRVINFKALKNSPRIQKQIEIEKKDERNVVIANQAKAKAYDLMTFLFGVLMLVFVLMRIDMMAFLLLVFAYSIVVLYGLYYRFKYEKEM